MEVDINGDGTIDFDEFLGMMTQKANQHDQESDLKDAFKIFDRDKNGFIDMKELKNVTKMLGATLTKDEVDEFMREADMVRSHLDIHLADRDPFQDGNGKLDYDEFVKMMLQY